jgi:hypothetical protein
MGNILALSPSLPPIPTAGPASTPRAELVAGLSFLEASRDRRWSPLGLSGWFDEHLVQTGVMMTPLVVSELSAGTVALHGTRTHDPDAQLALTRIVTEARIRVITALRGLRASPTDDRFLMAAIFTGRVRRTRLGGANRWVVRPEPTATLSGIVISLFAVDVLSHREIYDRSLCICDTCDRVTFDADQAHRATCPAHRPSVSGFIRKVTLAQDQPDAAPSSEAPSLRR